MSIAKMRAVTISGKLSDFDRVAEKYICGRDIHLENALSVMHDKHGLMEFQDANEYDSIVKSLSGVLDFAQITDIGSEQADDSMSIEDIRGFITGMEDRINDSKSRCEQMEKQIEDNKKIMKSLEPISGLDVDLSRLPQMEFISYRFGWLPKTGFITMQTYLTENGFFFLETSRDEKGVWGFCFSPASRQQEIDDIFRNLYFERVEIPFDFNGTPKTLHDRLTADNEGLEKEIEKQRSGTVNFIRSNHTELCRVYNLAKMRRQFSEIKRNAMHTNLLFFVAGWMERSDADKLEKEISAEHGEVMMFQDDPENAWSITPPTKLKNNFVFKPFEMFVKMYGMPRYGEIDPTPILAVTYILFFGIMFGDVGQAALLSIAGFILYKIKKIDLAGIVGFVGISGMVFGFVYGSFFGNEEIIPKLLHTTPIRPMEQAIVMLIATIAIGAVIILFGIILNILNAKKRHDTGEMIFGHNGIAGAVFYVSMIMFALNMVLKLNLPNKIFIAGLIISVIAMYMQEPLSDLVKGKKDWLPKNGMFYVENLFEMFEVVLSFFTNTLSFLRIGAFSIVHVGMMMVVAVLSQGGGVGGAIVSVIGNIIVMALEGLIVGIQVLRLEYYEMFSRYFSGGGKTFVSLKDR